MPLRLPIAIALLACTMIAAPAYGQTPQRSHWALWLGAFATESGRIVDNANDNLSHSESQGYGLLLALAFNDRAAFARIWSWTEQNLWVRDDGLLAWAWQQNPDGGGAIQDINNATDGDILIAWALLEGGARWQEDRLSEAGLAIANAVLEHTTVEVAGQTLLRPGVEGFQAPHQIVNPSYWVFPALARLHDLMPDVRWNALSQSGYWLLDRLPASYRLVPEWTAITAEGLIAEPQNLESVAGYNALRVPLYLIWAGRPDHPLIDAYLSAWPDPAGAIATVVDNTTGMPLQQSGDPGYQAIAALVHCARGATDVAWPAFSVNQAYYPATLQIFAELVAQRRYPACFASH